MEEVLSHLTIAYEMNYIPEGLYKELISEGDEIDKMLNGYIAYLKQSKRGFGEPGANQSAREEPPSYTVESGEDSIESEDSVL